MELKIDQEFKTLIPPMNEEELKGLEFSIQENGYDPAFPVVAWCGFVIDGHNRYTICQRLGVEPVVIEKDFNSRPEVINWIIDTQLHRRNISKEQKTYLLGKRYKEEKKEHGGDRNSFNKLSQNIDESKGNSCILNSQNIEKPDCKPADQTIAEQIHVAPRTVKNAEKFTEAVDTIAKTTGLNPQKILSNEVKATQNDIKKVATFEPEKQKQVFEAVEKKEVKNVKEAIEKVETEELLAEEAEPEVKLPAKKSVMNFTNDNIEWAKWTWNPVTGCKFGCKYCYARDIAKRFNANGFEPTFHENRLSAPMNTKVPKEAETDIGYKNVFVCSMADLFGDWIPQEWIDKILNVVRENSQWNFLFLTKNPKRLATIDFPDNCWVGTTVDVQARVAPAMEAFKSVSAKVKFLSCEPLQEELEFEDISMFDWAIIGGRSKSTGMPEGQPEWGWVEKILMRARNDGLSVYFKPNLKVRPNEYPTK